MWNQMIPALRITILLTLLTGLAYPGIVTALCQLLFPQQANGSLVSRNGQIVGSTLIGQNFTKPEYFQPRPSAAGAGYDAANSGGSNLGPTNQKLAARIQAAATKFRQDNPGFQGPIPADLLTTSASGLDPHLSPLSAQAQIPRIAQARHLSAEHLQQLIAQHTEGPTLGFLGDPRVNVLQLNLALDSLHSAR
jgi:K+-transporting ATPase ATPase C chain